MYINSGRLSNPWYVAVQIAPQDIPGTLAFLEKTWETFSPETPFEYSFLDETFDRQYQADTSMNEIFGYASGLTIFIACLGLFGLASFSAERRTKEIGIRKVMGATMPSLIRLITREFIVLVAVANVIAWPIAYYIMQMWLQDFAYRADIGVVPFLLGGILAFAIALVTVGYQAIRVARSNPVNALRNE